MNERSGDTSFQAAPRIAAYARRRAAEEVKRRAAAFVALKNSGYSLDDVVVKQIPDLNAALIAQGQRSLMSPFLRTRRGTGRPPRHADGKGKSVRNDSTKE